MISENQGRPTFDRVAYSRDYPRNLIINYLSDAESVGRIHRHPGARCNSSDLYTDYLRWCHHNDWQPTTASAFARHLQALGYPNGRGPTSVRGRKGIGLTV